jgi:chromosome segregation ATPase
MSPEEIETKLSELEDIADKAKRDAESAKRYAMDLSDKHEELRATIKEG